MNDLVFFQMHQTLTDKAGKKFKDAVEDKDSSLLNAQPQLHSGLSTSTSCFVVPDSDEEEDVEEDEVEEIAEGKLSWQQTNK